MSKSKVGMIGTGREWIPGVCLVTRDAEKYYYYTKPITEELVEAALAKREFVPILRNTDNYKDSGRYD